MSTPENSIFDVLDEFIISANPSQINRLEYLGLEYIDVSLKEYSVYIANNKGIIIKEMKSKINKSLGKFETECKIFNKQYPNFTHWFREGWNDVDNYTKFIKSNKDLENKKIIIAWLYALRKIHEEQLPYQSRLNSL